MIGIIEVKNLSFGYTPKSIFLQDISFEVKQGTFLRPKAGTIRIDKTPIESYSTRNLAAKVAVVRQESMPVFGFSVIETVMMARIPYYNRTGFESEKDRQIVRQALKATDTAQFAPRTLASLSGGERQRVYIARALAQNSPVLLLDEPTNFLDLKHQVGIYDLLKAAQLEKGKTIVAVTHDINLAAQYCDETLLLGDDSSYQHGRTKDVFLPEHIEKVYGVEIFTGKVGKEKFFVPLGKLAKDNRQPDNKLNAN
jgi:iron complex transport system ATP-binding protein